MSTEYDVLTRCARSRITPDDVVAIQALVADGVDWPRVWQQAAYHRVHLLLGRALETAGVEVPTGFTTIYRRHLLHASARATFLRRELGGLLSDFDREDIHVLPFKGPVISQVAYAAPLVRPFIDLDVLVRRSDYRRLEALLLRRDYIRSDAYQSRTSIDRRVQLWLNQQVQFMKGAATYNLDVHTDIVTPLYSYAVEFDELWERSIPLEGYEGGRRFSAEDMLLILCFQGIKDRWERIKYVCDVAELLHATPDLDWPALHALVDRTRSRRLLQLGLQLAHDLLDAPLPDDIREWVYADAVVTRLARQVEEKMPEQHVLTIPDFFERFRFHLAVLDSLATKVQYCTFSALRNAYDVIAPRENAV